MAEWRVEGFVERRELGRGAQGRVVLAQHERAGTPVAIKYLLGADPGALAALRAEARMLGSLTSPYVARLYRFVESERGAAIIMEAVDGVSLKTVLGEHGALAPEAALTVLKGSLLGLAAAHAVGVVHRDYKPANVVVRADGLSKLVDFGVAVLAGQGSASGTPAYMAPEQWRGGRAAPATDVYAATCVFYECVTGRRPFAAATGRAALMNQHLSADPDLADVPAPLHDLVRRGMAKDPAARPAGAEAFATELEAAATAAYGAGWEHTGVRALAAAAAALAALFPLAALGLGGGAAAGAAGSAAGGAAGGVGATGTGTAAGATAGKGVLATATGKAALAVAGTAVVASGAFVAVQATGDDRPTRPAATAAPTAVVRVASQSQTQTVASLPIQLDNAQYVTVSGLRDTALQQRVNTALRAPVDRALRIGRQFASDPAARRACAGKPEKVRTTVETGLSGPRLLSARYDLFSDWCQSADGQPPGEVVTVDLTTGKRLTATDVFRAETLTKAGLARLKRLVPERNPNPGDMSWHERCLSGEGFTRAHLSPTVVPGNTSVSGDNPPSLSAFLTPTRFELAWFTSGSDGCHRGRFAAPYGKVRELLKPEFAALLPA